MTPFEYLLLFVAVILGLAVADVATSLHRLLAAGSRVKWDWLAPLAALVAFLKIVTQWWYWFGAERLAGGLTYEMFLAVLASVVVLFLLSAAALPDDFGAGAVDLRAQYLAVSRRYWLLFALHWTLATGVSIWAQAVAGRARLDLLSANWLVGPAALLLVFIRNRWVHTVALVAFAIVYFGQFLGQPLAR